MIATSSARYNSQLNRYRQQCLTHNRPIDQNYIKMYTLLNDEARDREEDPEWQKNNLEYDLRSTLWIIEKAKEDRYAQNLYAALCNIRWQKCDVFPILKNEFWHCSWRYAGGIIADMRSKGDYLDWYCSGISVQTIINEDYDLLTDDEKIRYKINQTFVPEGTVTDEIEKDLLKLGWQYSEWPDNGM